MVVGRIGERVGRSLVGPIAKTLDVFRLENERWSLLRSFAEDDLIRAEPFDVIEIELGILWTD